MTLMMAISAIPAQDKIIIRDNANKELFSGHRSDFRAPEDNSKDFYELIDTPVRSITTVDNYIEITVDR